VADAHDLSTKGSLTRGKAILIGVLGIVLVVILYMQFGRRELTNSGNPTAYRPPRRYGGTTTAAMATKPTNITAATASNTKEEAAAVQVIDESHWKAPVLAKVIAYDPFRLPDMFPHLVRPLPGSKASSKADLAAAAKAENEKKRAEALGKLHTQMKELKRRGVTLILGEGDQYAAMIDDRMLHVGDKIDGFTVIAIDDENGVVIERKDSP
jgi:hypothetical protein